MSRKLVLAAVIAIIALCALSQDAYASCGPLVTITSPSMDTRLAIGKWQARVANTMNDLYSDWNYARKKSLTASGKGLVASGIPCNTR
jgi:hypothetical protein